MKNKNIIPVFFAVDDGYIPFLGIALKSLIDNASDENKYQIKILYTNVSSENIKRIKKNILILVCMWVGFSDK